MHLVVVQFLDIFPRTIKSFDFYLFVIHTIYSSHWCLPNYRFLLDSYPVHNRSKGTFVLHCCTCPATVAVSPSILQRKSPLWNFVCLELGLQLYYVIVNIIAQKIAWKALFSNRNICIGIFSAPEQHHLRLLL